MLTVVQKIVTVMLTKRDRNDGKVFGNGNYGYWSGIDDWNY